MSKYNLGGTIGNDWDIFVARSSDNGLTWTPPQVLNFNVASDNADHIGVCLATDGQGNWVAVWTSRYNLGGTIGNDYDIFVARSSDNGLTWTPTEALNTNAPTDSGNDYSPHLATDGHGSWIAVWDSDDNLGETIGQDMDILVARSSDNGVTWTPRKR